MKEKNICWTIKWSLGLFWTHTKTYVSLVLYLWISDRSMLCTTIHHIYESPLPLGEEPSSTKGGDFCHQTKSPLPLEEDNSPLPPEEDKGPLPLEEEPSSTRGGAFCHQTKSPLPLEEDKSPLPLEEDKSPLPLEEEPSATRRRSQGRHLATDYITCMDIF